MRLDHYKKLSNSNIELASITYSVVSTLAIILFLVLKLGKDLRIDFSKIEMLSLLKKDKKNKRLGNYENHENIKIIKE
jgi:hypothetical protein